MTVVRARTPIERRTVLLRLDPAVHDALTRWAADDLRSSNAQIEFLLRAALWRAGRLPSKATTPIAAARSAEKSAHRRKTG